MLHHIVEGEPGIFPAPVARVLTGIGGLFRRRPKAGEAEPAPPPPTATDEPAPPPPTATDEPAPAPPTATEDAAGGRAGGPPDQPGAAR